MAEDLEATGDKAGARKTRERLQGLEPDEGAPAAAPKIPSGPRRGDLVFLDTGVDIPTSPSRAPAPVRPTKEPARTMQAPPPPPPLPEPEPEPEPDPESAVPEGLVLNEPLTDHGGQISDLIIDSQGSDTGVVDTGDQLLGIERLGDPMSSSRDLTGSLGLQRGGDSSRLDLEPMTVEGMEGASGSLDFSVDPMSSSVDFSDDLIVSLPETETGFDVLGSDAPEAAGPSPLLDVPAPSDVLPLITPKDHSGDTLADLENRVLDDPENPDVHLELADKLLSMGESDRVAEELELALAGFEDRQDWTRASEMADRLVALMPDSIGHHQKRVELAYRTGDRGALLEAYLGLGDALANSGALDKAAAVYGRVIEHDPGNTRATAALARVGGEPPKATSPERARKPEAPPPVEAKPAAKLSAPPRPQLDSNPKSTAVPKPTAAPAP